VLDPRHKTRCHICPSLYPVHEVQELERQGDIKFFFQNKKLQINQETVSVKNYEGFLLPQIAASLYMYTVAVVGDGAAWSPEVTIVGSNHPSSGGKSYQV
jgi:hypothetical protein